MPLEDIRNERIKKVELLRQVKIDPYPAESKTQLAISETLRKFWALAKSEKKVTIGGRVMAKREHGGSTFMDLKDASGKIQVYFKKDVLDSYAADRANEYDFFIKTVDIGDFIEVEGKCFKTKKGEETIEVIRWQILSKSLRPLPEKWHGLQDVEERFRKRYLDLLMNEEVRDRFITRSSIIRILREFHEENGFLEIETPIFHLIPGGALAKPFITHHNALDIDLYLRIAPELYLKRLLVAGFERIFEIGKSFRNEGIDASHNPEFTMLECYAAYWNEKKMMDFVENIFLNLVKSVNRSLGQSKLDTIQFDDKKIVFRKPFGRITFKELLKRYALITDYDSETRDSIATRAKRLGIEVGPHESKGKMADEIYKKICRPYLVQPTFVTNHPLDISPLAKAYGNMVSESSREKRSIETIAGEARRFQLVVGGMELANGFAELNDPLEQRRRFEAQEKMKKEGELETHPIDEDYLEAMEYGMPPAAGLGIGIDRLAMLFTNTKNIREVMLFPTMRPK